MRVDRGGDTEPPFRPSDLIPPGGDPANADHFNEAECCGRWIPAPATLITLPGE
jgi:hypothetical protein